MDPECKRCDHKLRPCRQESRCPPLVEPAVVPWDLPRPAGDEEAGGHDGEEERHGVRHHESPEGEPAGRHRRARVRVVVRDVAPGMVKAAANVTVAISTDAIVPEAAMPLPPTSSFWSFSMCREMLITLCR